MTFDELMRMNEEMVDRLDVRGGTPGKPVEAAMRALPRHLFLPGVDPAIAYVDDAVVTVRDPVTGEATSSCSQPSLVAMMLYQLDLRPGLRVLEIGTGTGYNAAIIARFVDDPTLVWTVDLDCQASASACESLALVGVGGVNAVCGDGRLGHADSAPYDRIIVTAAAQEIPLAWVEQLSDNGLLVVPFGPGPFQNSFAFRRTGSILTQELIIQCSFMRLRGKADLDRKIDGRWRQTTVEIDQGDILSRLAFLHSRILASRWGGTFGPIGTPDGKGSFGFYDPDLRAAWSFTTRSVSGWGPDGFVRRATDDVRGWFYEAGLERTDATLAVCRRDAAIDGGPGAIRIAGQQVDYVFARG